MGILIQDKVEFKTKGVKWCKKGTICLNWPKGTIDQQGSYSCH